MFDDVGTTSTVSLEAINLILVISANLCIKVHQSLTKLRICTDLLHPCVWIHQLLWFHWNELNEWILLQNVVILNALVTEPLNCGLWNPLMILNLQLATALDGLTSVRVVHAALRPDTVKLIDFSVAFHTPEAVVGVHHWVPYYRWCL